MNTASATVDAGGSAYPPASARTPYREEKDGRTDVGIEVLRTYHRAKAV
jgi:hypothetical protein